MFKTADTTLRQSLAGSLVLPLGPERDPAWSGFNLLLNVSSASTPARAASASAPGSSGRASRLSAHGLAGLHGSSPDVGIAGYSLGGGMGWLAASTACSATR